MEVELTDEEREGIKNLALSNPNFLYIILEEMLAQLNGDEILKNAIDRWMNENG